GGETLDPAFRTDHSPRLARARCQSAGRAHRSMGGAAAVATGSSGGGRWQESAPQSCDGPSGSPSAECHPAPGGRGRGANGRGRENQRDPQTAPVLDPLPLAGTVVTADALHTQKETARYLVEKKKADYLFIAKDNQPTLRQDIADLHLEAIPPSAHHDR